jgi:hypothetical protein
MYDPALRAKRGSVVGCRFQFFIAQERRNAMESLGTILLVIGIWLVLQFILRKAGLPT